MTKKSSFAALRKNCVGLARLVSVIAIASAISVGPAWSQDTEEAASRGLDVIIVEARKRAEDLQRTPVTANALNKEALESYGVASIEDITEIVPNLSMFAPSSIAQGVIGLRGIETGGLNFGFDQAVSINIDGVAYSNSEVMRTGQFDLERVEVLRGPQALFFGKNSPAGTISLRTADPGDEFYMEARAGFETAADRAYGHVIFSGPASDTVGIRLAGSYADQKGWFVNTFPGVNSPRHPNYSEYVIRGTVTFEPTDRFDARAKVTYSDLKGDDFTFTEVFECNALTELSAAFGEDCAIDGRSATQDPGQYTGGWPAYATPFNFLSTIGLAPTPPAFDASQGPLFRENPEHQSSALLSSLEMNYELNDELLLTSISGYSVLENFRFDNFSPGIALSTYGVEQDQTQFTHEVRLTGDYDRFDFMLGAYYDNRHLDQRSNFYFALFEPPVGPYIMQNNQFIDAKTWSVFAQVAVDVTDQLELSVGARYTDEDKNFEGFITDPASATGVIPPGTPIIPADPIIEEDNISPEVTLSYEATDDMFLFASYKQGYKSGSFDTSQFSTPLAAFAPGLTEISFLSETAQGFEAGAKTEWFDNTLRLNVTAFNFEFDDLQLSAVDTSTTATRTDNAGKALTRGVELEMLWAPQAVDGLTITANGSWLKAEYLDYIGDCHEVQLEITGPAGGCNVDVDNDPTTSAAGAAVAGTGFNSQQRRGTRLRGSAPFSFNLGANYTTPLTSNLTLATSLNANWRDKTNPEFQGDPRGEQDAVLFLNASIGIIGADDAWQLDVIGRNLTDELRSTISAPYFFGGGGFGTGIVRPLFAATNPPREIMIQLTLRPALWMQ